MGTMSSEAAPAVPPLGTTPVRAVLLDADGVLQIIGTPWQEALTRGGGPAFSRRLLSEEVAALEGRESLHDLLTRLVEELGIASTPDELVELWHRATPDPLAWQLVRDLRAAGYVTVLATNQQPERRQWMRTHLGYDGLCDVDAYSCTLGVAKPAPEYFETVLRLLDLAPDQALFVDDNAHNVASARALGLETVHHPVDAGGRVLRQGVTRALRGPAGT